MRAATAEDSEFAFLTKRAAFREYVEQVWGWNEDEQRQLHAERFRWQEFRLVDLDGAKIGVVAIVRESDCVRLNQLFLLPEHQGRGIGRRCMLLIMDEARGLALPVRLQVLRVNPRARAFYERLGFSTVGAAENHHVMEWRSDPSGSPNRASR